MIHQAGLLIAFDVVSAASVPHDAVGNTLSVTPINKQFVTYLDCLTNSKSDAVPL